MGRPRAQGHRLGRPAGPAKVARVEGKAVLEEVRPDAGPPELEHLKVLLFAAPGDPAIPTYAASAAAAAATLARLGGPEAENRLRRLLRHCLRSSPFVPEVFSHAVGDVVPGAELEPGVGGRLSSCDAMEWDHFYPPTHDTHPLAMEESGNSEKGTPAPPSTDATKPLGIIFVV